MTSDSRVGKYVRKSLKISYANAQNSSDEVGTYICENI